MLTQLILCGCPVFWKWKWFLKNKVLTFHSKFPVSSKRQHAFTVLWKSTNVTCAKRAKSTIAALHLPCGLTSQVYSQIRKLLKQNKFMNLLPFYTIFLWTATSKPHIQSQNSINTQKSSQSFPISLSILFNHVNLLAYTCSF